MTRVLPPRRREFVTIPPFCSAPPHRYARTDEVGTPYGVTVDFDTLKDSTVTLRERDSQSQLRVPIADIPPLVTGLVKGWETWTNASTKYPIVRA